MSVLREEEVGEVRFFLDFRRGEDGQGLFADENENQQEADNRHPWR